MAEADLVAAEPAIPVDEVGQWMSTVHSGDKSNRIWMTSGFILNRNVMTNLTQLVLVASMFALCPSLVQAQVNPFRSVTGLRSDDFKLLGEAEKKLLARPSLEIGSTEFWYNDKTGASGTVSVEDANRHRSLMCHRVDYETTQRGGRQQTAVLNWCKTPSGWKIG